MALIRLGNCNHCGECCKPPIVVENPCMELGDDKCKFYTENLNNEMYGHCIIHGRGNKPITSVKDRTGKKITQSQIKWFNQNCMEYPTIEDAEAGTFPLPDCGFSFEVVIDA